MRDVLPATSVNAQSRLLGLAAFAIIALLATIAVPFLSSASTYQSGLSVDIDPTDQLEGNVYVVAPELRFDATAQKDVSIATITGDVHGRIGGNLHLLAGRTDVHAEVEGSVYVMAGNVSIHNRVGGDVVIAGGNVTISPESTITGDLIVAGGTVQMDGTIRSMMYGTALNLQQHGTVNDGVEVQASRLVLHDSARVSGDIHYQSPAEAKISSSAQISGAVDHTNAAPWSGIGGGALSPFGSILKLVWSLLAGATVIGLMPRLASRVADHGSLLFQPAAVGLIAIFMLPVIAMLLLGTILGIPIGIIMLALIPIGLYLSQVFAGLTLGRFLMPRSWRDGSRGYMLLAMTLGVIIIGLIRMAPVPFLGPIVTAIVTFWGFGALVLLVGDLTSDRLRQSRPV